MIMDESNIEHLKEEIDYLKVELSKRESNFSEKRAQFKELYIMKEQELAKAKNKYNDSITELKKIRNELNSVQTAAALSEAIRKEELDSMKQMYNNEIASINGIMKENIDLINKTKQELENKILKLESEKMDLNRKLEEKNSELMNNHENVLVKIAQRLKLNTHEIFKGLKENSDENMEDLSKAQNDAEILKSVVEPYEEDVKILKSKIRDAYERIDQLEAAALCTKSIDISHLQQQITNLESQLRLEKDTNIFLKQTLSQVNDKYFETENKLLRNEKLMTESQKLHIKSMPENRNSQVDISMGNSPDLNKINHVNQVDLLKSSMRKSLSGNDIKYFDEFYQNSPHHIARRNTDAQLFNTFSDHNSAGQSQRKSRVISENEWSRMQLELASLKNRSNGDCEMCKNYEDQLQSIQNELKTKEKCSSDLKAENKNYLRLIYTLQESNNKLSCHINDDIAGHEKSITSLNEKIISLNDFCDRLRSAYERFRDVTDQELKHINNERRVVKLKMEKIELAYDNLLCKRVKRAIEMEAELIELPTDIESAQFYLLKLKEDLISCRAANEHLNETMQSLEMFNKEKEKAEKEEKDAISNEFNNEKKELEIQVEMLQSELNKRKAYLKSSENLEETIRVLKAELDAVKRNYSNLEMDYKSIKSKSQALQQELENSESVQQDFVRLSQTLQIQLEKIRQEEKELRWQFKEDVSQCNECQNDLCSTSDKKKYHCKHCGRIFCKNCLVEICVGTNSKKAVVCKVCHTLLVKDAVPYFSTNKS